MNRSVFPNQIDTFVEHYDIQSADQADVSRYQQLKLKSTLTPDEQTELGNLTTKLREKIFTPEDFNKLQDCITNLETFFTNNVQGFVTQKQNDMQTYVNNAEADVKAYTDSMKASVNDTVNNGIATMNSTKDSYTTYVNNKETEVSNEVTNGIAQMEDKKNYFINYCNTKEQEVQDMVHEFSNNSVRYTQVWDATAGQMVFDIYNDTNRVYTSLPQEANLNIAVENIDFIVNGVPLVPKRDYVIIDDGSFARLSLVAGSVSVTAGAEVIAKWYKNVGKLYFTHASTHGFGGSDPLTVTENMLDSITAGKLNRVNQAITISKTAPTSPALNDIWIDAN